MTYKELKALNDSLKNNSNIQKLRILDIYLREDAATITDGIRTKKVGIASIVKAIENRSIALTNPSKLYNYNFKQNAGGSVKTNSTVNKVHLLIEDTGAGYQFWQFICKCYFTNVVLDKKVTNNKALVDEVNNIVKSGSKEYYIILIDQAFDNPSTITLMNQLSIICSSHSNLILVKNYICFESVLLSFYQLEYIINKARGKVSIGSTEKILIDYIRNECNTHNHDRTDYINAKHKFKELYPHIKEIHTIEQLSSHLLTELTKNSGLKVTKGDIGKCWTCDCHTGKILDCNLQYSDIRIDKQDNEKITSGVRITRREKAYSYIINSYIHNLFKRVGVYNVADIQL